ncbi:Uncharacterised protein [uncultured archaeon]|nr:Uncharacterised protein [uncultured archaeon]
MNEGIFDQLIFWYQRDVLDFYSTHQELNYEVLLNKIKLDDNILKYVQRKYDDISAIISNHSLTESMFKGISKYPDDKDYTSLCVLLNPNLSYKFVSKKYNLPQIPENNYYFIKNILTDNEADEMLKQSSFDAFEYYICNAKNISERVWTEHIDLLLDYINSLSKQDDYMYPLETRDNQARALIKYDSEIKLSDRYISDSLIKEYPDNFIPCLPYDYDDRTLTNIRFPKSGDIDDIERYMNEYLNSGKEPTVLWQYKITRNRYLSDSFFERHLDWVDWRTVARNPSVSDSFLERHFDAINWKEKHQFKLSFPFYQKHLLQTFDKPYMYWIPKFKIKMFQKYVIYKIE